MQMIFLKLESCFNCRDVTSVNTDFLFLFWWNNGPLFFFFLEVSQHCDKRPKAHFLFVLPVCIYDLNTVVQAATRKGSATTHNFFFLLFKMVPSSPVCPYEQLKLRMWCCALTLSRRDGASLYSVLYMSEFTPQCFSCESSCFSLSRIRSLLIFLNICHIVQSL